MMTEEDFSRFERSLLQTIELAGELPQARVVLLCLGGLLKAADIHGLIRLTDTAADIARQYFVREEIEKTGVPL